MQKERGKIIGVFIRLCGRSGLRFLGEGQISQFKPQEWGFGKSQEADVRGKYWEAGGTVKHRG